MSLQVKAGTTSYIDEIFIQDSTSTTGAGKTGLVFGGITAYYTRPGAAATAITVVTQTVTGAYSSGGFVEIDATHSPGLYRFDPPNAVFAAGANNAVITFTASGAAPVVKQYQITDWGQLVQTNVTGTAQAGTSNSITLAAGASAVDNFYRRQRLVTTGGTGAGQSADIIRYDGTGKIAYIGQAWGTTPDSTTTYAIVHTGSINANVVRTGVAQSGTASTIVLDTGASATDGLYIGSTVWITGGTGSGQSRNAQAYTGSSKTISVTPNWATPPDSTSVFELLPLGIQAATDYATTTQLNAAAANIIAQGVQAADVWQYVIEGGYNAGGMLSLLSAENAGAFTISGTTYTFTGLDGSTARIVGTANGTARTITTLTPAM